MKKKTNKRKIIVILILVTLLIAIIIFFTKKDYNQMKFGNNISNKTMEELKNYILNISSYEAEIEVTVNSNKNQNKYILKQAWIMPNIFTQEVIEPSNIKNLKIIYDGNNLKIENTNLNLSKIYEEYQFVAENTLCLNTFIENYKKDSTSTCKIENEELILETKVIGGNQYRQTHKLYVSTNTGLPIKMEIKDINKNISVYILYNEIKINSSKKEDVLAFILEEKINNI